MIGTIDIRVNAAHPNLPLSPVYTFVGSPQQVRIVNVPKAIGSWRITGVQVSVNYPDNSTASVECVLDGGCWHGTLAAPTAVGQSLMGFKVTASGVKEDGLSPFSGAVLGKGDALVLDDDATITIGETTYYVHMLDAVPATPHKGDLAPVDGVYKLYNGEEWISLGGSATVAWENVTGKPTAFPPQAHTHADDSWFTTAIEAVKTWAGGLFTKRNADNAVTEDFALSDSGDAVISFSRDGTLRNVWKFFGYSTYAVNDADGDDLRNKYVKPTGGIPKTDLASAVQDSLDAADAALPTTGGTISNLNVTYALQVGSEASFNNVYVAGTTTGLLVRRFEIIDGNTIIVNGKTFTFPNVDGDLALTSDLAAYLPDATPAYSASATYAVGEFVRYNGAIYVCKTAIASAEAWTPAHWTAMPNVSSLFSGDNTALVATINSIIGVPNALLEAALSGEEVA